MDWQQYIDTDPNVLGGKPKISGTRISVELILQRLADGWSIDDLCKAYPHVSPDQIRACIGFAAEAISTDEIIDVPRSAA